MSGLLAITFRLAAVLWNGGAESMMAREKEGVEVAMARHNLVIDSPIVFCPTSVVGRLSLPCATPPAPPCVQWRLGREASEGDHHQARKRKHLELHSTSSPPGTLLLCVALERF